MALPTLPDFNQGDVFDHTHINQVISAIQKGELDINIFGLLVQDIPYRMIQDTGHGYYHSTTQTEAAGQVIAANNDVKMELTIDPLLTDERLPMSQTVPFWDDTNHRVVNEMDYGNAIIRVTFKAKSAGNDKQIAVAAIVADGITNPTIFSQTLRLSKQANVELDLAVSIPVWFDDFTKNGIEVHIANDAASDIDDITIWDQKVLVQASGGNVYDGIS